MEYGSGTREIFMAMEDFSQVRVSGKHKVVSGKTGCQRERKLRVRQGIGPTLEV